MTESIPGYDAEPVSESEASREQGSLTNELLRGNRDAAEALVTMTYRMVYASLFRLCGGEADLAADLTQETYRKAWTSLGGFEKRAKFSSWLYRIAYNTFLNHQRTKYRTVSLDEDWFRSLPDDTPHPEALFSGREQSAQLRRAVLTLPEKLRFCLTARYWGDLPVREIAELEGVSVVAIRKRLVRAMTTLRQVLPGKESEEDDR